jgi:hypothetical protein
MTEEQRNRLDGFKSLLMTLYNVDNIKELSRDNAKHCILWLNYTDKQAMVHSIFSFSSKMFFDYDLETGEHKKINISDSCILPISNNVLLLERNVDEDKINYAIKVLDKDTLETVKNTEINIGEDNPNFTYLRSYDSCKINTKNYISIFGIDYKQEFNIDGKRLDINSVITSNELKRVSNGISYLADKIGRNILLEYDNIEDMNLLNKVELVKGKIINNNVRGREKREISYYIIFNKYANNKTKSNIPQVIFIKFNKSGNIYAYNFEDKQIHEVNDTRLKIDYNEFKNMLFGCTKATYQERKGEFKDNLARFQGDILRQQNYEMTQYNIDCRYLEKSRFNSRISACVDEYHGKMCVTIKSLKECVDAYQYRYDKESRIMLQNWKGQAGNGQFSAIDDEVFYNSTPYNVKSHRLIYDTLHKQDDNGGKLEVLDKTISVQEIFEEESQYQDYLAVTVDRFTEMIAGLQKMNR